MPESNWFQICLQSIGTHFLYNVICYDFVVEETIVKHEETNSARRQQPEYPWLLRNGWFDVLGNKLITVDRKLK